MNTAPRGDLSEYLGKTKHTEDHSAYQRHPLRRDTSLFGIAVRLVRTRESFLILLLLIISAPTVRAAEPIEFRNGFWINLHHYLYAQALAETKTAGPRLLSTANSAIQHAPCTIPGSERVVWTSAVEFYATHYISKDWLFDDEMRQLNDALGQMGDATGKTLRSASALPEDLREVLIGAAAVYRHACWPAHHGANAAWIGAEKARLAKHGATLVRRLEQVYLAKWPEHLIADVVTYANWAGAYTYGTHITIDSVNSDYQEDSALEMIFHESSHALDTTLFEEFADEFKLQRAPWPRQFDHALIFYTAGILTKQELARTNPSYVPYGDRLGIFQRLQGWSEDEAAFDRAWKPYLEGKKTRKEAIQDVVKMICCKE